MPTKKISDIDKTAAVKNALKKQFNREAEEVQIRYESFLRNGFSTEQAFDLTLLYLMANLR